MAWRSCSIWRAASRAPERAICSIRSIMLCRSCGRTCRAFGSSGRASCCGFWRSCSASACMNLSSAARRSSVRRLISSSVAPRSSAWRNASSAFFSACWASERLPSSRLTAMSHSRATTSRNASSFLAWASCQKIERKPEIDLALHVEAVGRERERVERGEHVGLGLGIERENPPLLDQRPRHRLGERPLRQAHLGRLALAFVAGLVAGGERHLGGGAGPWIVGQILAGLADAVAGARLRQRQRKLRRLEQRRAAATGHRRRPRS